MSKQVVARYNSHGKKFEVVVYPDKAWIFKNQGNIDIREVLVGDMIYYDVGRGLKASPEDLKSVFGTDDVYKIAEKIIRKGELQLTAQQRREMIESKRRQIIDFISRNCIDPRTGLPHPPKRVELALEEARIGIDPFIPVEVQVEKVIKALSRILPLKISRAIAAVKIPPQYVGKAYGYLSKIGRITRSEYQSDGTLIAEIEIPAGLQNTLIEKVNALTKGSGDVKIISRK